MLDDIRNVHPEEHWETLRRRWGALLSYRYIGRQFSSMNTVADDTVTLRHDMRNAENGEIAATCELTAVHLDRKVRKSAAFEPAIRAAADKLLL